MHQAIAARYAENVHRRHLNANQRAVLASDLAELAIGGDGSNQWAAQNCATLSQDEAGQLLGVSRRSVQNARAAIERWASAVIAIGAVSEPGDDGTSAVEISIAAQRYERGDRVVPARYDGRTGRWWLTGDSRPAQEVRAERQAERTEQSRATAELAIVPLLARSPTPLSATQIRGQIGGRRDVVLAAIRALVQRGEIVHCGRARGGARPVWTPDRAAEAQP